MDYILPPVHIHLYAHRVVIFASQNYGKMRNLNFTSTVIANLCTRYCDNEEDIGSECDDDVDGKFVVFPVFGFVIMIVWVSIIDHDALL